MIDHILRFANEAAAKAALPDYVIEDTWDGARTIPGLKIITQEAVWDHTDRENPVLVTPQVSLPGWCIAIALPALSTALRDLPENACRLIADRGAAAAAQPFIVYAAPDLDTGLLATARIEPVFAGSTYPFGAG